MNSKRFGEYVKNKRYELGFSTTKAAAEMNISVVQLRNIENGKNCPRPETFFKIIKTLGIDSKEAIDYLDDDDSVD